MKKEELETLAKGFSCKNLPESEVECTGEVPYEVVLPYREKALSSIAAEAEFPGFRKGKVPTDMVLQRVGEVAVLEEAVNLFVREFYPALVETQKTEMVGRPEIRITKLAPNNPVALTVRSAIYPEIVLPSRWKTLGESVPAAQADDATEEELNETLESLRKARKKGEELPELNDEFAKSVGTFENLAALKEQITKGIGEEKVRAAKEKRRGEIIEKLLEKTDVVVPKIFVESELDKIMSQLKDDVTRFGLTYEGYLKQANKTEEALRTDFRLQAQKRAKLQLVLNKIAEDEKIEADRAAVEQEMKHALEHFPSANPELLGIHISTVLRNEKILQLLENSSEK